MDLHALLSPHLAGSLADVVSQLNDRNVHVKMVEGHSNRRTNDTRPHDQDIWSLHKWEAA